MERQGETAVRRRLPILGTAGTRPGNDDPIRDGPGNDRMNPDFAHALDRLDPAAVEMFCEMVETHLAAGEGDRIFIRADSMDGCGLIFSHHKVPRDWDGFDGGYLDDLVDHGFLNAGFSRQGTPNYRVASEGRAFYRWLQEREGAAVAKTEYTAVRLVQSAEFAARHRQTAHHLNKAFALLDHSKLSEQTISEIGDHLRKALMDIVEDVVDQPGLREQPVDRLDAWISTRTGLHDREQRALVALAGLTRAVLRLDHRLNHVRDEADKKEPSPTEDEVRRAAFLTTLTCYEISILEGRPGQE